MTREEKKLLSRQKIIDTIVEVMKRDISSGNELYYDGVVIDFEGL